MEDRRLKVTPIIRDKEEVDHIMCLRMSQRSLPSFKLLHDYLDSRPPVWHDPAVIERFYEQGTATARAVLSFEYPSYRDLLEDLRTAIPDFITREYGIEEAVAALESLEAMVADKKAPLWCVEMGEPEAAALRQASLLQLPAPQWVASSEPGWHWVYKPSEEYRLTAEVRPLSDKQWWEAISSNQTARETLASELKGIVQKMRGVEDTRRKDMGWGKVGACEDQLDGSLPLSLQDICESGPQPVKRFYSALCTDIFRGPYPGPDERIRNFFKRPSSDLAFTHGALVPDNTICDREGHIVEITGWETAGWLPMWWEATQALRGAYRDEMTSVTEMGHQEPVPGTPATLVTETDEADDDATVVVGDAFEDAEYTSIDTNSQITLVNDTSCAQLSDMEALTIEDAGSSRSGDEGTQDWYAFLRENGVFDGDGYEEDLRGSLCAMENARQDKRTGRTAGIMRAHSKPHEVGRDDVGTSTILRALRRYIPF